MCSEIQVKMAARFAEPTKVEIMAVLEKATPDLENTKKQLNMRLRFLTVSLRK